MAFFYFKSNFTKMTPFKNVRYALDHDKLLFFAAS